MGVLDDVRRWLKEIPIWQELEQVPGKMQDLERRVEALEKRLETRPGETCPKCGEHTMRLKTTGRRTGPMGVLRFDQWACTACDHEEERAVNLAK